MSRVEKHALALIAVVLGAYPLVSFLGGPVWAVSVGGAALGVVLCAAHGTATPRQLGRSVAWDILLFLFAVFVMAIGPLAGLLWLKMLQPWMSRSGSASSSSWARR